MKSNFSIKGKTGFTNNSKSDKLSDHKLIKSLSSSALNQLEMERINFLYAPYEY